MSSLNNLITYFLEVLDNAKSDCAVITLRYPIGGSRRCKPPAGPGAEFQCTLFQLVYKSSQNNLFSKVTVLFYLKKNSIFNNPGNLQSKKMTWKWPDLWFKNNTLPCRGSCTDLGSKKMTWSWIQDQVIFLDLS